MPNNNSNNHLLQGNDLLDLVLEVYRRLNNIERSTTKVEKKVDQLHTLMLIQQTTLNNAKRNNTIASRTRSKINKSTVGIFNTGMRTNKKKY